MSDGRSTGLILMGLAVAAFLGSTSEALPPATFFPALALFGIGAVKFLKSSREALADAERRTQEKLHPVIRENRSTQATAERMAHRRGAALNELNAALPSKTTPAGRSTRGQPVPATPIDLDPSEADLVVTQDVSFPVEVQRGDALADQLRKLNLLLTQGILTEEEYAIAKAKLLG
jgi:hypothetical protein